MKTDIVVAWSAGFIDGEGSVSLYRRAGSRFRSPEVSACSTDLVMLERLEFYFCGSIRMRNHRVKNHKQAWEWRARDNDALHFLRLIRPYMLHPEKCRRADVLLVEYKEVTIRNGQYTSVQEQAKFDFERRFLNLT